MFLRHTKRTKNGKIHRYWSIVENRRLSNGTIYQRPVLYLGEINDRQERNWQKTISVFSEDKEPEVMALFPDDFSPEIDDGQIVQIRLREMELHNPRQWGACWLACRLYEKLGLDEFWKSRLQPSRKGTPWDLVLQTLVTYRLLAPGSEWRLHRQWFERSAMADLLGANALLGEIHRLYDCHDLILQHREDLFAHLTDRWTNLFDAKYEVILFDLTSTYFEIDPPDDPDDKRKFGYSRDHRPDCVQVVIAMIITPEGFPLGYEVLAGNTLDKTTLSATLRTIEQRYGKTRRLWIMDRGIPTEKVLAEMRASDPATLYLVGTSRAVLKAYAEKLAPLNWQNVRDGVRIKSLSDNGEQYLLVESVDRAKKERAIRCRQVKLLWKRLREIQRMKPLKRDDMMLKLGAAKNKAPKAWRLLTIEVTNEAGRAKLSFSVCRENLQAAKFAEGRYLLRSNLNDPKPGALWEYYMTLTRVEDVFRHLKGDLGLRPIFHQGMERIEAHIFISFLAYCMQVTLDRMLHPHAAGLTGRAVLEKFAAMQMIDVRFPTTDGRHIVLPRYTQPQDDQKLLLQILNLELPAQPPPRIDASGTLVDHAV